MKSLQKQFLQTIKIVVLGLIVGVGAHYASAVTWTPPTATPPNNNTAAPINVSSTGQSKVGGLTVATGAVTNGLIVANGNVGIGTTNPTQKVDVPNGYIRSGTGFCIAADCIEAWPTGTGGGGVGPGTIGRIAKFVSNTNVDDSIIRENGSSVSVGADPSGSALFQVEGSVKIHSTGAASGKILASTDTDGNAAWKSIVIKNCEWLDLTPPFPNPVVMNCPGEKVVAGLKTIDSDSQGFRGVQSIKCCEIGLQGL